MPKIDKVISLEITPEQFLNSCSDIELREIDLLLQSPRYYSRIYPKDLSVRNSIKASKVLDELQKKLKPDFPADRTEHPC